MSFDTLTEKCSTAAHSVRAAKAPEGWRSPSPGGILRDPRIREASWTAVVLYRFSPKV